MVAPRPRELWAEAVKGEGGEQRGLGAHGIAEAQRHSERSTAAAAQDQGKTHQRAGRGQRQVRRAVPMWQIWRLAPIHLMRFGARYYNKISSPGNTLQLLLRDQSHISNRLRDKLA